MRLTDADGVGLASLPMYDRPELAAAHDRYWSLISAELVAAGLDAPHQLTRVDDLERMWRHPDLVLSQTCGMPYRTTLIDAVSLIGTPDYAVEGCPPGYYRSAIVVRRDDAHLQLDDFSTATFAYNDTGSQSGWAAPYEHLRPRGVWFERLLHTGGHAASAQAVADGRADIASLDAVSWRLIERYDTFARELVVLEATTPTPGLPYISAAGADQPTMFTAVDRAISKLTHTDRQQLGIVGFVSIPAAEYTAVPSPPPSTTVD